jgi:hypothetical protein
MGILTELTTEYSDEPLPIVEALTEAVKKLSFNQSKSGAVKGIKDAAGLYAKNKGLAVKAISNAVDAYSKSKSTTLRHTIKLHAKTPYEKRMVKDIVNAMTKKGDYKVYKSSYKNGGKEWELRKVGGGAYKRAKGQG